MNRTPPSIVNSWEKYYGTAQIPDWDRLPADDLAEFMRECRINWRKIRTLVDVGCGTGVKLLRFVESAADLNRSDVKIIGIDLSEKAIEMAQRNVGESDT